MAANSWAAVCRFGGVGDDLIVTSPLSLLKEKYGHVEVITQAPQSDVFIGNPYIDKLTVKEPHDIPGGGGLDWQKWFVARSKEYAFFQNLSHSVEARLALVPGQTQFYWPAAARRKYCGVSYLEITHDICDVPHIFDPGPRFYPTDAELEDATRMKAKMGGRVIGWALGGTRRDKIHPVGHLAIARLLNETDCSVLMFGTGGRDFDIAKVIDRHVREANSDNSRLHLALSPEPAGKDEAPRSEADTARLAEKGDTQWPLRRSLTQVQMCDMLISPDSGLAWSVAMLPMPKVMLLSHASPQNITAHWVNTVSLHADQQRVPCSPCHMLHDTTEFCPSNETNTGSACISDITVEQIVSTAKRLLAAI